MNSLIGIFKKSKKGDSFRVPNSPDQYNDGIAMLNSVGPDQYQRLTTQTISQVSRDRAALAPDNTSGNTVLPGSN